MLFLVRLLLLVMRNLYAFFKTKKGQNIILAGWRAAGITGAIKAARMSGAVPMNPFKGV